MAHPRLFLASLCLTILLTAAAASATACPPQQTFSGTFTPTSTTATFVVTTTAQGDTYFQLAPKFPGCNTELYWYTIEIAGNSMRGHCSEALVFVNANAATYTVHLSAEFGVDGLEDATYVPYELWVYQANCT
jgi:hypothetical protein